MSLVLHGVPLSPFVRKVRIVLAEKQCDYEMQTVIPYATREDYTLINPLRRVPALQDGDITLCDSAVICDYLETTQPDTLLYPTTPVERARALWLEKYADYELAPASTFRVFFQHIVQPTLGNQTDAEIIRDAIAHHIPPHLDYLETQLAAQQWFISNQFSIADIAIASQLINLQHAGYQLDAQRWPGLSQHLQRTCQRDSVSSILHGEQKMVEKIKSRFNIGTLPLS